MEIELVTGTTLRVKPRGKVRTTSLAVYREIAQHLFIDEGLMSAAGGAVKMDVVKEAAPIVIVGMGEERLEQMLDFFVEVIVEAPGLDEDWAALEAEDRRDALDMGLSQFEWVLAFVQTWSYYQGLTARTVIEEDDDCEDGEG